MSKPTDAPSQSYQSIYAGFDSPLMRELRRKAYGEDIGQHSWVTAEDLRGDLHRLGLTAASRLLDLGCGPCGPLTFLMKESGCLGTGLDLSSEALAAGRRRASALSVDQRLTLQEADLDAPLALAMGSFDAVVSLDVILHLRDRSRAFGEIARVLVPGGRLLFTDAGIITGSITSEEVAARSLHGFNQFSATGCNERMLEQAGFRLLATEDRTAGLLANARGRMEARLAQRAELESIEGATGFARYLAYLQAVIDMSARGAVSRLMYLAETRRDPTNQ